MTPGTISMINPTGGGRETEAGMIQNECPLCSEAIFEFNPNLHLSSCYRDQMLTCGFSEHEILECWKSPQRMEILESALQEGEREL